jgi:ubiquinone/menaquinone biosynthesis C-methylase UbiE
VSQLVFDQAIAEQLEAAYRSRGVVRRRELVYAALAARPGERIADVGCGPGFYVAELLDRVGPSGSVTGIDRSAEMLAIAAARIAGRENGTLREGEATAVPVADGEVDAALSVQVLEYVPDVDAALGELNRIVRPGGRVLVWDVDWTIVSWHSADPARMRRALDAWDGHLAHPALPRTLAARLRRAGFADVGAEGHAFTSLELSPDTYLGAIFPLVESYIARSGALAEAEATAWADEQRQLSERGELFFACIQFCFTATKPPP